MPAILFERKVILPGSQRLQSVNPLANLEQAISTRLEDRDIPVRLAIVASSREDYHCEVGVLSGWEGPPPPSLFHYIPRPVENTDRFNCALLVPTGIGAEIGGHAGDASPVATLLAAVCDTLITHPNVVNASDIIDLPANALYVEGSLIARLLTGSIGLQRARNNRVLVALGHHDDALFINAAINSVNAARATYGLNVPAIKRLPASFEMESGYVGSGRAAGKVRGLDTLLRLVEQQAPQVDALAIASQIIVPPGYHAEYFDSYGEMVNPWGGVEAMLTHTISSIFNLPSAHAPMLETQEIANADPGIVDPRMAAEGVSLALIQSVLKGLQRSPKIITAPAAMHHPGVITSADVSCLVIPDGCLGIPVLAALGQGIPVIAVRENRNLMNNDLTLLPWAAGQFHLVENYWEAAGVMSALKAGIDPAAVRRPLPPATVTRHLE